MALTKFHTRSVEQHPLRVRRFLPHPPPCPTPHLLCIPSPAAFLQTKLRGRKGGRLYIFAWCIFKPEVSKPRVERSTTWKKKRNNTFFDFYLNQHRRELLWQAIMREGVVLLLWRKGGGCPSGRVGRIQENKAKLHLSSCLVFYAQANCISVHESYASPRRTNGKVETFLFFLCYPLQPDSSLYNEYGYLVMLVDWTKDAYGNLRV